MPQRELSSFSMLLERHRRTQTILLSNQREKERKMLVRRTGARASLLPSNVRLQVRKCRKRSFWSYCRRIEASRPTTPRKCFLERPRSVPASFALLKYSCTPQILVGCSHRVFFGICPIKICVRFWIVVESTARRLFARCSHEGLGQRPKRRGRSGVI